MGCFVQRTPTGNVKSGSVSYSSWWFQPSWKIFVKIGNLPQVRVNIKKYLKPPPSVSYDFYRPGSPQQKIYPKPWFGVTPPRLVIVIMHGAGLWRSSFSVVLKVADRTSQIDLIVCTMGTHVSFIFKVCDPYIEGVKPSFFMVLGSKGIWSSLQGYYMNCIKWDFM